jgi:predicted thioredoxin/glutaredoxin
MVRRLEGLRERVQLPPVTVVDVDSDADLVRRYGLNVPVLLLDGAIVCRHRLDEGELLRLLRYSEGKA